MQLYFLVAGICVCVGRTHAQETVVVTTKYGDVKGLKTTENVKFLGIPYAAPPVGKYRWKEPVTVPDWKPKTYDATEVKPGCPQKSCVAMNPATVCPKQTSEDCLYLNIWAPASTNASSGLPVMVYLHGGNFIQMSASSLLFDGGALAAKGEIIVVNLDYRLGALGFLLTATASGVKGNLGILDQRKAMQWVAENIRAFGGDPNKVTLSGQSAGAQSVVVHLMNPESTQYFHHAIIESAPLSIPFKTYPEALLLGDQLTLKVGCIINDLDCLMSKSADDIAQAEADIRSTPSSLRLLEFFEPWGPYVDGRIVPFQPLEAVQRGKFKSMPLLIGTVTEETRVYVYEAWRNPMDLLTFAEVVLLFNPKNIKSIVGMYPPVDFKDERDDAVSMATDFVFTCCTRNYTRTIAKNNSDIYMYVFDHAFSFDGWGPNFTFCKNHVCHGSEIPYVFQSVTLGNMTFTPAEQIMSDTMVMYWSNFVKTGNPNKGSLKSPLTWPPYSVDTGSKFIHLATPSITVGAIYRQRYCDYWDSLGYHPF